MKSGVLIRIYRHERKPPTRPPYKPDFDPFLTRCSCLRGGFSLIAETQAAFAKPEVDPLEAVFAIVHGIFVNVRFPPGADGKPNFADAWSAMIDK